MTKSLAPRRATKSPERTVAYENLIERITQGENEARRLSARAVNAVRAATYWLVGRHIVEYEQAGAQRAEYGEELLARLSRDLSEKLGRRGFVKSNLYQMRAFYLGHEDIFQAPSGKSLALPEALNLQMMAARFPLPWSAYVCLLSVKNAAARRYHEAETLLQGVICRGLDTSPAGDYIKDAICSPLDQPQGLRRGFAFGGFSCP